MKVDLRNGGLVVRLESIHRSLSSAVLGGGLSSIRTWLNLQVDASYDCDDPEADLRHACIGLDDPVVGMLTAANVDRFMTAAQRSAHAITTVGLKRPIAAAEPLPPNLDAVGTINLLAVVDVDLTDEGLVNALQTAVEAKAQALASARVTALNSDGLATGTATDSICVACPPGETVKYCGPATPHGHDLAQAVYRAVLAGVAAYREAKSSDLDAGEGVMGDRGSKM